jgi:hypothetical protein
MSEVERSIEGWEMEEGVGKEGKEKGSMIIECNY